MTDEKPNQTKFCRNFVSKNCGKNLVAVSNKKWLFVQIDTKDARANPISARQSSKSSAWQNFLKL